MTCKNPISKFTVNSPIGDIAVTYCVNGLHRITQSEAISGDDFQPRIGQPVIFKNTPDAHLHAQACVHWLSVYFSNPKNIGAIPLPQICRNVLGDTGSFTEKVCLTLLKKVEFGQTITYKGLAAMVGNPGAVRAAGGAMANNPLPLLIPCHRVLPSPDKQGVSRVGNYARGRKNRVKEWLLQHEGFTINDGAARAVGNALAHNPLHIMVPCHRVLRLLNHHDNSWTVGNYISGPEVKQWLLQHEGQTFSKRFVMIKKQD